MANRRQRRARAKRARAKRPEAATATAVNNEHSEMLTRDELEAKIQGSGGRIIQIARPDDKERLVSLIDYGLRKRGHMLHMWRNSGGQVRLYLEEQISLMTQGISLLQDKLKRIS